MKMNVFQHVQENRVITRQIAKKLESSVENKLLNKKKLSSLLKRNIQETFKSMKVV